MTDDVGTQVSDRLVGRVLDGRYRIIKTIISDPEPTDVIPTMSAPRIPTASVAPRFT